MKEIACNYCGRDETILLNRGPDLYLKRDGDYRLVVCQNCGLIYQNPQLTTDELLSHYPAEDYELYVNSSENESAIRQADRRHGMVRRCKQIIHRHPNPGSLLDIGCATGHFMAAMKDFGWQVSGVELNPDAAAYARDVMGLNVYTGMLEESELFDQRYDVVTMWDVLEHVLDPRKTLERIGEVLNPGGLFVASTPNPTSLEAKLFGNSWAGWDRPRHTYLFTPKMIRQYLADAGFKEIEIISFSGRLRVTLLSLEYLLAAKGIYGGRWHRFLKTIYNWPVRLATWPIYRLAESFNQTTNMCVIAR